ncbi:MAG: DUF4386 domain-containing protein [Steroidobacteraceae bacterium]
MHTSTTHPQRWARTAGAMYLAIIAIGAFGELFARGTLVVSGDPAATADRIIGSMLLWRASTAADVVMHVFDVPVMLAIYVLLRPVNANLALLALVSNVVQTSVLVANKLNLLVPALLLQSSSAAAAFTPAQVHALAQVSIAAHEYGFALGLVFFGVTCLVEGHLIARSGYLPALIGRGMQLAGLCYLVNSFALIIEPSVAARLFPVILLPPFVAELAFASWLLVRGVDLSRWPGQR